MSALAELGELRARVNSSGVLVTSASRETVSSIASSPQPELNGHEEVEFSPTRLHSDVLYESLVSGNGQVPKGLEVSGYVFNSQQGSYGEGRLYVKGHHPWGRRIHSRYNGQPETELVKPGVIRAIGEFTVRDIKEARVWK